ncbi:MAG: NAD(P)H-hydrate epimerase, partial [Fulvivirga sp.]|nr:NAD(P)H-hydrate epimerase [Fulvivirga sp.]
MKILSAKQVQKVDQFTIENEPIPSIDLMERAANAFVNIFFELVSPHKKVAVVSGRGNNGGDGLAIARLLIERNYEVDVFAIQKEKKASEDFTVNEERLQGLAEVKNIADEDSIPDFGKYDVLIDGMFGSGLSRPVEGLYADVINKMNSSNASIVAIDIPSGVFADEPSKKGAIVKARHTITFQLPKLALLLPENQDFVGQWHVVDIGLSEKAIANQDTSYRYITDESVRKMIKKRGKF